MQGLVVIFVIVACLGATLGDDPEWKGKLVEICKECGTSAGLSEGEMDLIKNGKLGESVTDKTKVYANCMLEKTGFMNNGVVQDAKINEIAEKISEFKKVDKEKVLATMNECKALQGTDKMDTSFKILDCLQTKAGVFGKPN